MKLKHKRFGFTMGILLLAVLGFFYLQNTWQTSIKLTKDRALERSMNAEAGFQPELFGKLELLPEDVNKPEYQWIKSNLLELAARNKTVRFIYFYTVKDGKAFLMADSEPLDSKDYSAPGQEYTEADQQYIQAYEGRTPVITGKVHDRWGEWISVLIPVINKKTGELVTCFGMDYDLHTWYSYAIHSTLMNGLNMIFIILFYIMGHVIYRKNSTLKKERNKLKETYSRLLEREEVFRTLFEQAPYGISFGNIHTNIVDTNYMFEKIVGRSREELKTLTWMEITHPDDIQLNMDQWIRFKDGEIPGFTIVKRYVRPDDSIVWVNLQLAAVRFNNNEILSHICIVEDITDKIKTQLSLQESERSLSMLLSNLPGMAYRCDYDRDWTMRLVSEGCLELTGYPPESLIQSRDIAFNNIINEEYRDYLWEKWKEVTKTRSILKEEYSITTAQGEVKWVYEQAQGVYNENGEVIAIEGLIIDISKQKNREEEILYLTYHDVLTGLYNRRYYEETKKLIDKADRFPLSVIVGDINGLKLINSAMGHQEGDRLIQKAAQLLSKCCRAGDILCRTGGDEFSILMPETTYEEADRLVNLIGKLCEENREKTPEEVYHLSISVGCSTKTEENTPLTNIIKEAEESMYRHKLLQNKSLHSSIISTMKSSLFEKNQETEEHAQRLIELSRAVGQKLNLVEEQLNELELLSTLHDIGKIGISDNILNKPGKLTEEEWIEMKRHPEMGYRIAMATPELAPIADYILNHHERWDGTGYPYGRKGEEIPLLSRIISVADAYDAMTSDRSYRNAMTKEQAIEEIRRNSGTQFDPYISELFLEYVNNL